LLAKDVEKQRKSAEAAAEILARITPTDDYALLGNADLVVEAVFEDTGVKAGVTARAEAVLPEGAIFASNTSTLPISGLAKASKRPAQFIGLHFFSPVERMALVEVIMGKATSQETLAKGLDFVAQLRKTPIIVNDSRGFYTSRVFQTFIHEGAAMLAEGVNPARIENAAKQAGMPVGPLALIDELTADLPIKIVDQAIAEEGSAYEPPCGATVMRKMIELKRSGRKIGAGFYEYPEGSRKHLWSGLKEIWPVAAAQPEVAELKTRFLYAQAMETVRCLEENVLTNAADGDLGAVLGWGFPSWTGGTLSVIDTVGAAEFVKVCDGLAQRYGKRFTPSAWLRARAAAGDSFLSAPRQASAA
jgi:3-hydroxyacyl-CoA dehydrogenase/enoyl-CoA hydratase/3-hydroxybutyryl-CoA epimerase